MRLRATRRPSFLMLLGAILAVLPAMAAGPVSLVRGDAGDRLVLDASLGASWQEVNVGRLAVRTPGAQTRIDTGDAAGPSAKTRALATTLVPRDGCGLIIADLGPGFDKGRPDAWQRVTHATKLVACARTTGAVLSRDEIDARREAGSMLMAKTGSRVEIQPLANPATLRPGADLPVRAYCDSAARPGLEVAAVAPDGSRRYATTDAVGAAVLRMDRAGPWSVEAVCEAAGAASDAQRLTATLTFEVLAAEAWARIGEAR